MRWLFVLCVSERIVAPLGIISTLICGRLISYRKLKGIDHFGEVWGNLSQLVGRRHLRLFCCYLLENLQHFLSPIAILGEGELSLRKGIGLRRVAHKVWPKIEPSGRSSHLLII